MTRGLGAPAGVVVNRLGAVVSRQAAAISGVMPGFRRTVEGPGRHPRKQERELVIVRTSPLAKRYG